MFASQIEETPVLLKYDSPENVNKNAAIITSWLSKATKEATIEQDVKDKIYWWKEELAILQCQIRILAKQISRCKDAEAKKALNAKKKDMMKAYKLAIADCKNKAFRDFINSEKPWG